MLRLGLPLVAFIVSPMLGHGQVQIQGHRGCRGLFPENTIPAFLHALNLGVDVLELDVVVTGDGYVLVSHEPWMNPEICTGPEGQSLVGQPKVNIYQLRLSEVRQYDCGSLGHRRFPNQQPVKAFKPTLEEVFQAVRDWRTTHSERQVLFNIEIKCSPEWEHSFCPPVQVFCDRVLQQIQSSDMRASCMLQSFNTAVLEYLNQAAPDIPLAFLVERGRLRYQLKKLSFQPAIYSPKFSVLTSRQVREAHRSGIQVIPWTVNEPEDIQKVLNMGVDGIITDYPDRVLPLKN
ncbi:MAG: glycerophosphodiester phosphodiesterase [Lewinellaceae bacterium]|nr:glycerophosphodiester phosphodiesterase [Saprospiraceae bacterium]MCB9311700.1 glycerophosphodiester phosphodiesterase [Lewinellaceae bacterium]HRW75131.1 glycerophosphodiester phosphodiesterase family protein [Saprospiraceae bacterium]